MRNGVIIVGGGIGGVSLAIALARAGVKATLIEREKEWLPSSSGIFIYSNGLRALRSLGVLDAILATGWESPDGGNLYLAADGRTITRTIYPRIDGAPAIVGMRRLALHAVLVDALRAHDVETRLGVTVASIDDTPGRPLAVTLSDGARLDADALIGADGVRSQIRTHLFGAIEPTYTGFGVWRSTHAKPADVDEKIMMMGLGTRLGLMPTSSDELYMFGTTREPGKPLYPREEWHTQMRSKFAEFGGPCGALLDEIVSPDTVIYTAVEEVHLPLPWSRGRIGLIGDAAHSSSPFMGQGGAMAIEDAVVLAAMLAAGGDDVAQTLLAFGERRFARCKFVQDASRKVGEAGATENADTTAQRDRRIAESGQGDVDAFYAVMAQQP